MLRYLLLRLFSSLFIFMGAIALIFVMARMIGDPVVLMVEPGWTQEQIAELRESLGLDLPVWRQFIDYIANAAVGDFGISPWQHQPAFDLVLDRLPATIQLAATALVFAITTALVVGIFAALYPGSLFDRISSGFVLFGQSIPNFWLGLMMILVFSSILGILPPAGHGTPMHLIMPTITLSLFFVARLTRLVRSEMHAVLEQDFIRTARSKGITETRVVLKHALKNISIPLVTVIAVDLGALMGGAVVTETVFAWPGIGRLMIQATSQRDFPVIQAAAFVIAAIVIVSNLVADLLYAVLNPRIRYA